MGLVLDAATEAALHRALQVLQRKGRRTDEFIVREKALQGDDDAQAQVAVWDEEDGAKEFPLYRHDGEDVQSVGEVAAIMGVKSHVAALYVLEQKDIEDSLRAEAKELAPQQTSGFSGVAVMLYPSTDQAKQIAIEGGSDWSQIHCTLGYFGNMDDLIAAGVDEQDMVDLVNEVAKTTDPIGAQLNGITRFSGPDDEDHLVVSVDSPEVEDLRHTLKKVSKDEHVPLDTSHGYTPHITLGTLKTTDQMPISRWAPMQVTFDTIVLSWGDHHTLLPLHAVQDTPEAKDVSAGSVAPGGVVGTGYNTQPGIPLGGPRITKPSVRRARRLKRRTIKGV